MKALVVDDSYVTRKLITNALSRTPIQHVDHAVDGEEAIKTLDDNTYDLILMDWNMPKKTGLEAVTEIRGKGIDTPIIMVTTESELQNVLKAIKQGATNYLVKPFKPSALAQKVNDVLAAFSVPDESKES